MHVDGFRFDLASVLGRDPEVFSPSAPFFRAIAEDPVLAQVKLIAEPWDLGPDGYQGGRFPPPWYAWNDAYRDALRRQGRGDGSAAELDAAARRERSIVYVTAHDGFTLADLVSYERKHNHVNGEDNRDGNDHELSRNWGVEGPSDDPAVGAARDRARKKLFAALAAASGVPMVLHGDEIGRSQRGNNNAYCQDNEIAWVDWSRADVEFLAFARQALEARKSSRPLRASTRPPE